mgnify:CR=1 FL=1
MKLHFLEIAGVLLLVLHLLWIVIYYYYGAIKIYNLTEKNCYQYLGCLWIKKVKGEYRLKIPQEMLDNSFTTQYKIVAEDLFVKRKQQEKVRICFGNKYYVYVTVGKEISVKNHIATSRQL